MENFSDILTPGRLLLSYGNGNKVRAAPKAHPADVPAGVGGRGHRWALR